MNIVAPPTLIIVTGMSGSGKSTALKVLEDSGFFCIDNVPTVLIPRIVDLLTGEELLKSRIAFVIDVRDTDFISRFPTVVSSLRGREIQVKIIFLDCKDDILIRRFSETRRRHPLSESENSLIGITREREVLSPIKGLSDLYVDTSGMNIHQLREFIVKKIPMSELSKLNLTFLSFGFRYGIPPEADSIFDVRFLPNPFFEMTLSNMTGLDEEVRRFVLERDLSKEFSGMVVDLLGFLLPHYIMEGKSYFTVGFGCTGGRHRSVAIAGEVARGIGEKGVNVNINIKHRDIERV